MKKINILPFLLILSVLPAFFPKEVAAAPVDNLYKDLQILDKSTNITRKSYMATADGFYKLYASNPAGGSADEALLGAARAYRRSYERFKVRADLDKSLRYYSMLQGAFSSSAARDAYLETSDIYRALRDPASAKFSLNKLINKYPDSSQAKTARKVLASINKTSGSGFNIASASNNKAKTSASSGNRDTVTNRVPAAPARKVSAGNGDTVNVHGIRYFSDKDYTRVVVDLSGNADYRSYWLKEDPKIKKPPRLTIDIDNSVTDKDIPRQINIKDGLLSSVRLGYHSKEKRTRIVLDSENIKDFTVFQMNTPSRIVVDLYSTPRSQDELPPAPTSVANARVQPQARPGTPPSRPKIINDESRKPDMEISRALGLKVKTIVIDAGHGGKDPGAVYNNVKEKDVILDIAKHLRDYLKKDSKLNVYMTRDTDVFIPLEERTAIANKYKADIFISVHANAAKNTAAAGVETYVFNVTNDRAALEVAALENNATTKATSDLSDILKDILKYSKLEDSLLVAGAIQKHIMKNTGSKSKNLGVKQAPFYVLLGARMPAVLIETGFVSNKDEAARLKTQAYRKQIAKGIYDGLQEYISMYNH